MGQFFDRMNKKGYFVAQTDTPKVAPEERDL
jgi:hypothetical protein